MARRFLRWKLQDIIEVIEKSTEAQFDCNILIEGKRGLGKSTLAWKIARKVKLPFKPKNDLLYTRNDIIKAITNYTNKVIVADEFVNIGYKRDFYKHGQKQLIKALNMYRDSFNLFIGCIPRFVDLDIDLQALCKIRLTVVRRGFALVHKQVSSIYTKDPWDIRNNQKIEAEWTLKRSKKPRYLKLTTCIGFLKFGDISPAARKIYETIKHDKRNRIYAEHEDLEILRDPNANFYKNLYERMEAKKLTPTNLQEICIIAGKKYSVVRMNLNTMLKDKGEKGRVKDFVGFKNLISKKDGLGFKLPEEPREDD